MGGSIVLSSEPNVGSTFTFSLGFQRADGSAPAETREEPLPGMRALVVHDNLAARRLLVGWLSAWQIEASAVSDGLSAMQVLMASAGSDNTPVRLLLVDGNAPGMPSAGDRKHRVRRGRCAHELRLVLVELPGTRGSRTRLGAPREVVIQQARHQSRIVRGAASSALRRMKERRPSRQPARVVTRTSQSRRVLVAEDNEFNVVLTRELLLRRGHDVQVVRSGMDALAELERARYDVLLLDLHMPEMDGFEVIRNLRAREQSRGGHLSVIALTARARPADRERCLAAGMDDFLAKPINSAALWGAVERVSAPVSYTGDQFDRS